MCPAKVEMKIIFDIQKTSYHVKENIARTIFLGDDVIENKLSTR